MDLFTYKFLRENLVFDVIRYINDIQTHCSIKYICMQRIVSLNSSMYFSYLSWPSLKMYFCKYIGNQKTIKCGVTRL